MSGPGATRKAKLTGRAGDAPKCPGCHIGCKIDRYQCGRGQRLCETWRETGVLPERRQGPPPGHRPDASMRLMFGLGIVANMMQDRRERQRDGEVLYALMRHGGLASEGVLKERTRLSGEMLASTLRELEDSGLVERVVKIEHLPQAARLTDAGAARVEDFRAERRAADEEFLAPLSPEELEQLDTLLHKLFPPPPQNVRKERRERRMT